MNTTRNAWKGFSLNTQIKIKYLALLVANRFFSSTQQGSIVLFGKRISYEKRGSFHGMFKEIFVQQNYCIEATSEPLRILDGGANIGMSLLYFRLQAPNAIINAFEPNPHTFAVLKKNVTENNLNVKLHNVGLSGVAGPATLYTDSSDLSSQSASLTKHLETKQKTLQTIDVAMERLSDYVTETIDILKLDIEGAEGEVIEELALAQKLSKIKKIFIEYHYDGENTVYPLGKLLHLLETAGFKYVIASGVRFPFHIPLVNRNYSYKITAWQ